jgi:hypothetical protein
LAADLPAFTNEAQASRTSSWPAWLTLPPSLPSESHSTARRARNLPARRAVLPVTGWVAANHRPAPRCRSRAGK